MSDLYRRIVYGNMPKEGAAKAGWLAFISRASRERTWKGDARAFEQMEKFCDFLPQY